MFNLEGQSDVCVSMILKYKGTSKCHLSMNDRIFQTIIKKSCLDYHLNDRSVPFLVGES